VALQAEDVEGADGRSRRSGASRARTAARSAWAHSRVFSDGGEEESEAEADDRAGGGRRGAPSTSGRSARPSQQRRQVRSAALWVGTGTGEACLCDMGRMLWDKAGPRVAEIGAAARFGKVLRELGCTPAMDSQLEVVVWWCGGDPFRTAARETLNPKPFRTAAWETAAHGSQEEGVVWQTCHHVKKAWRRWESCADFIGKQSGCSWHRIIGLLRQERSCARGWAAPGAAAGAWRRRHRRAARPSGADDIAAADALGGRRRQAAAGRWRL
jgi:hypothetical protein